MDIVYFKLNWFCAHSFSMIKIRSLQEFLQFFPMVHKIPVHWEVHFNKMVEQLDVSTKKIGTDFVDGIGIGPILAETTVKYKYPLKFPANVLLGATILPSDIVNKKVMTQRYATWGLEANRIVTEGTGTIVAYDYRQNKKADQFPDEVLEAFIKLSKLNSMHMLPKLEGGQ